MARTLITGGTVVSATGAVTHDVLVEGETVVALLSPGTAAATGLTADTTIDAAGCYVVPGGIDAHTHMELPFGGTFASDTFETGTVAAAHGGTTTIIDFAVQTAGGDVRQSLDTWYAKAEGNCAVDYAFHMIIGGSTTPASSSWVTWWPRASRASSCSWPYPGVFYSDDGQILRAMQRAAELGAWSRCTPRTASRSTSWPSRPRPAARRPRSTTASPDLPAWRARPPSAPSSSPWWRARRSTSST
jgi:dihydropyrimidinase